MTSEETLKVIQNAFNDLGSVSKLQYLQGNQDNTLKVSHQQDLDGCGIIQLAGCGSLYLHQITEDAKFESVSSNKSSTCTVKPCKKKLKLALTKKLLTTPSGAAKGVPPSPGTLLAASSKPKPTTVNKRESLERLFAARYHQSTPERDDGGPSSKCRLTIPAILSPIPKTPRAPRESVARTDAAEPVAGTFDVPDVVPEEVTVVIESSGGVVSPELVESDEEPQPAPPPPPPLSSPLPPEHRLPTLACRDNCWDRRVHQRIEVGRRGWSGNGSTRVRETNTAATQA